MLLRTCTFSLVIVLFFSVCKAENYLRMDEEGRINAKLNNVSLLEIKDILQDSFEIDFIGDEDIYHTQLTMSFDGLNLDRALKRLFHKFNYVVEYNSEGKATEISIFSHSGGFSPLPQRFGSSQVLSNNFKEIYAKRIAALQTLDHFGNSGSSSANAQSMMPKKADQKLDLAAFNAGVKLNSNSNMAAFKVQPNTPPGGSAIIDPSSFVNDDAFKVERHANPSGKDFKIVPSAPPSRKK